MSEYGSECQYQRRVRNKGMSIAVCCGSCWRGERSCEGCILLGRALLRDLVLKWVPEREPFIKYGVSKRELAHK